MGLKLGSGPGTSVKGNRSKRHTEKGKETEWRKKVWRMKGGGGNHRDRRELESLLEEISKKQI